MEGEGCWCPQMTFLHDAPERDYNVIAAAQIYACTKLR